MSKDLVPVPSITVADGKITDNLAVVETKVTEITQRYTGMVVTDVKEARSTLASLRKLSKAINDERIRAERVYLEPFEAIKERVEKLKELIEKPISEINTQIKDAEKLAQEKRVAEIQELITRQVAAMEFGDVLIGWFAGVSWREDPRWTQGRYWTPKGNPTAKLTQEIEDTVKLAKDGVGTIMSVAGEFTDQVLDQFKISGDLGSALGALENMKAAKAEADALKARRAEQAKPPAPAPKPEPVPEPPQAPVVDARPEVELPSVLPPLEPVETPLPAFMMDAADPPAPAFMGVPNGDRTYIISVVCSESDFQKVRTAFALAKVGFEIVEVR